MTPQQRLDAILATGQIRGFRPYGAPVRVVCFTESTTKGLQYLAAAGGFSRWGIVFKRQVIYNAGGGPVFHLRGEHYSARKLLPPSLQSMVVRFEAGRSEWLHEREWRIPLEDGDAFEFPSDDVEGIIVETIRDYFALKDMEIDYLRGLSVWTWAMDADGEHFGRVDQPL